MISRNNYENLFMQHGISRQELCMMTDFQFKQMLQYFLNNPVVRNNENETQYRFVSQKQYEENQRKMKHGNREPLIAHKSGMDSAYQTQQGNNYNQNNEYQYYDEEAAFQQALYASMRDQYNQQDNNNYGDYYQEQNQNVIHQDYSEPNFAQNNNEPNAESEMHPSSSYSYVYKENPTSQRIAQNDDQRVFDEQTMEYQKCCEEAFQKDMEKNLAEHYENNQQQIEREEKERKFGEVVSKYYSLKPEPPTGTTIAAFIHNERLMRKFDPNSLGQDVYTWVAGQTIDDPDDDKLFFDNFQLQIAGFGILNPEQTLAEQGIKGRVMVNVIQE